MKILRINIEKTSVIFLVFVLAGLTFPFREAAGADGTVLKKYLAESGLPNAWVKGIFRDGDRLLVSWPGGTSVWDPAEGKAGDSTTATLFPGRCVLTTSDLVAAPAENAGPVGMAILPDNTAPTVGAGFNSTVSQQFDLYFTQTVATGSIQLHTLKIVSLNGCGVVLRARRDTVARSRCS